MDNLREVIDLIDTALTTADALDRAIGGEATERVQYMRHRVSTILCIIKFLLLQLRDNKGQIVYLSARKLAKYCGPVSTRSIGKTLSLMSFMQRYLIGNNNVKRTYAVPKRDIPSLIPRLAGELMSSAKQYADYVSAMLRNGEVSQEVRVRNLLMKLLDEVTVIFDKLVGMCLGLRSLISR